MTARLLRSIQQRIARPISRSPWPLAAALLASAAARGFGAVHAQPVVWEQVGGEATIINGLAFDEADTLWAIGPSVWGLRHMPPGSGAWVEVSDYEGNDLLFTDAGTIILESGGLGRSTDRGRTFEDLFQPAGGGLYEVEGGPLAGRLFAGVDPGDFIEGGAVFSTDDGQTWTYARIGTEDGFGGDAQAFLGVDDGPNAGRVVAACYNGLAYTDDGGLSWTTSSLWVDLAAAAFSVVRLPPGSAEGGDEGASGRRLLAAVDAACCPERIWASDDDGETWAPLAALDASAQHIRLLYVGATAAGPETVYAVTVFSEVWRSGDGGQTWEGLGNIYPEASTRVKDAVVGPDGRLYVAQNQAGSGAPSNGVWRTVAPVTVASEGAPAEAEASRLSVYPNPTRGAATVVLTLAEAADVRTAVYDVLGREVAMLHDGRLASGEHRLTFDGSELPVGLYVIRATGSGISTVRRVTVIR